MSLPPPVRVEVPIRIRVDSRALTERPDELDAALAAATGRALERSCRVLLADAGPVDQLRVDAPQVTWAGDGLAQVDADVRAAAVTRVEQVLTDAVADADLDRLTRAAPPTRDPFAPPTARQRRRWARTPPRPVGPVPDPDGVERDIRGGDSTAAGLALLSIWEQIVAGDETAFRLALTAVRPDGAYPTEAALNALKELAKRRPRRLRDLLTAQLGTTSSGILRRSPTDLLIDRPLITDPATTLRGAAAQVSVALPAARAVREALDADLPGLVRLIGLLQAVTDRYVELEGVLEASAEATGYGATAWISARIEHSTRLVGALVELRGDDRLRALLPELEADVRDIYRWLGEILERLGAIEASLGVYRELFGGAADQAEEVVVLRDVRGLLLEQVATNPLPTRGLLSGLREQADEAYADWQGRAADRRIERLRRALEELRARNAELHEYDPYYDRPPVNPGDPETDLRVPFVSRLRDTRQALAGLERVLSAGEVPRDLPQLMALEQQLVVTSVRLSLLALWMQTLALQSNFMFPRDLGSDDDQSRWHTTFTTMRAELTTAYATPDFTQLVSQIEGWNAQLADVRSNMKRVHRKEVIVGVLIDVGSLVIAVGAVKVFKGAGFFSTTELTLIEAGTFTLASGVGRSLLLDQPIDPSRLVNQFADTIVLFGAFKIVDALVAAVATRAVRRLIGPNIVAEFAAVVGTSTVVSIGLSTVVSRVQSGEWPESIWVLVAGGVLMGTVSAALGTPALLRALRERGELLELIPELISLHGAARQWNAQFLRVNLRGDLSVAQWAQLQTRGVDLARRLQTAFWRMGRLSEETLRFLGLERSALAARAASMGKLATQIDGLVYIGPARPALPGPAEIVPGRVRPAGEGTFEYDPAVVNSTALARRFDEHGFEVANLGGGVLRVVRSGVEGQRWHLLPAGRELLALPPAPGLSEIELAVLAAVSPAPRSARDALDTRQWTAVVTAAELDPELVRRAIQAAPDTLPARLDELTGLLRAADVDAVTIERATTGLTSLNEMRRTAQAYAPDPTILAAAGPGALQATERILATPDGRALVAAASHEPALVSVAIVAPELVLTTKLAELAGALRTDGLIDTQIRAAQRALEAIRLARRVAGAKPLDLLLDAAARQGAAYDLVGSLELTPEGKALLDIVSREPNLARQAVAAETKAGLRTALSALERQPSVSGASAAVKAQLRETLTGLNKVARTAGSAFESQRRLSQVTTELRDQQAFRTAAEDVLRTFSGRRRREGFGWLQAPNRLFHETYELANAVRTSPELARLDTITLRDLWTRFSAPRARPLRSPDFASYVRVLQRHGRGQFGEWTVAFWAGERYLILKGPDASVTAAGTDLWLVPRGGGDILAVDVKELAAAEVTAVTALTRNFPRNMTRDVAGWDRLQRQGNPRLPAELDSAINQVRAAETAVQAIVQGLSKRQINTVRVQRQITDILRQHGIRRGVLTAAGRVTAVSPQLQQRGLEMFSEEVDREVAGALQEAREAETVDLATEIDGEE
jgi:hypothetical protein